MVLNPKAEFKGCKFYELALANNVRVKVEFGKQTVKALKMFLREHPDVEQLRIGFIMNVTLDQTEGSWAYPDEWQLKAWAEKPNAEIEYRVQDQNGYDRVATYMPQAEGQNFFFNAFLNSQKLPMPHNNTASKPRRAMEKVEDFL
jgi:hypothetical protein